MTQNDVIKNQDEAIIKKMVSIFCFFGGAIATLPSLFFIFFDLFYKVSVKQIFFGRIPWLFFGMILFISGILLIRNYPGKLAVFIKTYFVNFVILNLFQAVFLGTEVVRKTNENISEDMFLSFFFYSFVIFIFCFLPAAFKVGFSIPDKCFVLFSITLGIVIAAEIFFKAGFNYWTFLIFAIILPFFSVFIKKRLSDKAG
ncbi:MAG: hypothetical protein WC415_03020 [Patescibacteria group bacterium]|jgi:hypothetical protein